MWERLKPEVEQAEAEWKARTITDQELVRRIALLVEAHLAWVMT